MHLTTAEAPTTTRGENGFSSAGTHTHAVLETLQDANTGSSKAKENMTVELPYHIYISDDPFDTCMDITVPIKGNHPTLGMKFAQCEYRQRPRLVNMALSTSASRIPKWRSQLRNAYLVEYNHQPIQAIMDAVLQISKAREQCIIQASCKFSVDKHYGVHPQTGVPQIYFNQLNIIAQHLEEIRTESNTTRDKPTLPRINHITPTKTPNNAPVSTTANTVEPMGRFFKQSQLQKRDDWHLWQHSKFKQLDQYHNQGMFGTPTT